MGVPARFHRRLGGVKPPFDWCKSCCLDLGSGSRLSGDPPCLGSSSRPAGCKLSSAAKSISFFCSEKLDFSHLVSFCLLWTAELSKYTLHLFQRTFVSLLIPGVKYSSNSCFSPAEAEVDLELMSSSYCRRDAASKDPPKQTSAERLGFGPWEEISQSQDIIIIFITALFTICRPACGGNIAAAAAHLNTSPI